MPGAIAETKPYLKGLDDYYHREIEPWLVSREAARLAALRRRWLIIGSGGGGAAVLALLMLAAKLHPLWLLLPAALAGLAVFLGIRATSRLRHEVKAFLAEKLAAFFGFTYQADPFDDPTRRFSQLGLVPSHDRSTLEDHWSGSAAGVQFSLVEALLEEERIERDSKGNQETRYDTVFRGVLLTLACPRPFRGDILIRRDLGGVVNWFRKMFASREPVRFDDPDFEARFEVFADDPAEAHRLLEPRLRLGITAMAGDQSLAMAFSAGHVLLAVTGSNDRFELSSLDDTLVDPERVSTMAQELGIVFDAIECLNLQASAPA
jgi:Protein of unknown function (DUF3137)